MLSDVTAVSGRVVLHGVAAGRPVIVRSHYYPAWQATSGGRVLRLSDENGQMRFDAPITGDGIVELQYDRRTWLLSAAVASLLAGMALLARWPA
jgi:hypothetical protein